MAAVSPGSSITPSTACGSVVPSSVVREYPPRSMEATSDMPPVYRRTLLRILAEQARGELMAADTYSSWVRRAPGPTEKMYLAHLTHEETEHWCKVMTLFQQLGITPDRVRDYEANHWFYFVSSVTAPLRKWIDVLMMSFLIDHGAYFLVEDFIESSYAPLARMTDEILQEEAGHSDMGANCILSIIQKEGPARVQRALRRWWRVALNMFGPAITNNTNTYLRLGLKTRTNEDRRRAFRQACEPKIRALGLQVPRLLRESYPFF